MSIDQCQALANRTSLNSDAESQVHEKWLNFFGKMKKRVSSFSAPNITWLRKGDSNTAYYHRIIAVEGQLPHKISP